MPNFITEDDIEQAAIELLQTAYPYQVLRCYTAQPDDINDTSGRTDKKQVVLPSVMKESLYRINPDIPESVVAEYAGQLCKTSASAELMLTNYHNYQKIRGGIIVEFEKNGKKVYGCFSTVDTGGASQEET